MSLRNYEVKTIMELLEVSVLKTNFYHLLSIMKTIKHLLHYLKGQISDDPNWTSQKDHLRPKFDHLCTVIETLRCSPIYYYDLAVPVFVCNGKNAYSDKSPLAYYFVSTLP